MSYGKVFLASLIAVLFVSANCVAKDFLCTAPSLAKDTRPDKLRSETLLGQGAGSAPALTLFQPNPNVSLLANTKPLSSSFFVMGGGDRERASRHDSQPGKVKSQLRVTPQLPPNLRASSVEGAERADESVQPRQYVQALKPLEARKQADKILDQSRKRRFELQGNDSGQRKSPKDVESQLGLVLENYRQQQGARILAGQGENERFGLQQFDSGVFKPSTKDRQDQVKSAIERNRGKLDPLILTRPDPMAPSRDPQGTGISLGSPKIFPGMDQRQQIPIAGQSVENTIKLDRSTESLSMCALQRVHGITRPECKDSGSGAGMREVRPLSSSCSARVTSNWIASEEQLGAMTGVPIPALLRAYLQDQQKFKTDKSETLVSAVISHIKRTEELLDNCFQPVEATSFAQHTKVLDIVGKLIVGTEPVCTATVAGTSQYIITARHCFSKIPAEQRKDPIWFQPATSSDRFQVCAVAEADALDSVKVTDITRDQVLARIAVRSVVPKPLDILPPANLRSTADEANGDTSAPTLLTTVSFFPLANLVRPEKYKSGFVQDNAGICAAVKVQKGCFTHVCNVVHGGSGAPIFVSDAQKLILAGTHVGGSNENGLECKSDLNTVSNTGVLMNGVYSPSLFQ